MKHSLTTFILLTLFIASCGDSKKSSLKFNDAERAQLAENQKLEIQARERKKFLLEKNKVWAEINAEAKRSFKNIQTVFQNKCVSCHDSNSQLPVYGRILKPINPVNHHQVLGLKALDIAKGYPFLAQGNPPQLSILKAIRNAVTERTMPIKIFTLVYPSKKINDEDEKLIIDWVDPIIEKLQDYEKKYNLSDANVATQANKILELKCFRCHAFGNNKGNFGEMENTKNLLASKYVNLEQPDQSKLYTHIVSGKMPPNKLEALDIDEMNTVRDWLEQESKKEKK